MPRVTRPEMPNSNAGEAPRSGGQTVGPAGIPVRRQQFNTNADMFGAGVGRAIEGAGRVGSGVADMLGKLAIKKQREEDAAWLTEQQEAVSEWRISQINNGAFSRKGKDAKGVTEEYMLKFDEVAGAAVEGVGDRRRSLFMQWAAGQRDDFGMNLARHEQREWNKYRGDLASKAANTMINEAAANFSVDDSVASSIATGQAKMRENLDGLMPPEMIDEQVAAATSSAHAAVVDARVARGDADGAREYLDANADSISGTEQTRLENLVRRASEQKQNAQKSLEMFDSIKSNRYNEESGTYDYQAMVNDAYAIKDAEQRDNVLSQVDGFIRRVSQFEAQRVDAAEATMDFYFGENSAFKGRPQDIPAFNDLTPNVQAQFTERGQEIYEERRLRLQGIVRPESPEQKAKQWEYFKDLMVENPHHGWAYFDEGWIELYLPRDRWEEAYEMRRAQQQGTFSDEQYTSDLDSVNRVLADVGVTRESYDDFILIRSVAEREIKKEEERLGRSLNRDEARAQVASILYERDNWGFDYPNYHYPSSEMGVPSFDGRDMTEEEFEWVLRGMSRLGGPMDKASVKEFLANPQKYLMPGSPEVTPEQGQRALRLMLEQRVDFEEMVPFGGSEMPLTRSTFRYYVENVGESDRLSQTILGRIREDQREFQTSRDISLGRVLSGDLEQTNRTPYGGRYPQSGDEILGRMDQNRPAPPISFDFSSPPAVAGNTGPVENPPQTNSSLMADEVGASEAARVNYERYLARQRAAAWAVEVQRRIRAGEYVHPIYGGGDNAGQ